MVDDYEMIVVGYSCNACSHSCEVRSDTLPIPNICLAKHKAIYVNWKEIKKERLIQCDCGRITRYVTYKGKKMCEQCYYFLRRDEEKKKKAREFPTKSKVGSTFLQSTDL